MKTYLIILLFVSSLFNSIYSQEYLPGDNELLLMPTAYTMPESNSYFSDYELFLLNYSYAVSSSTHIGVFSLFPIVKRFYETASFGMKQKLISNELLQSSIYGTYTPKTSSYTIGSVISIGQPEKSFHASLAYVMFDEQKHYDFIYMFGVRFDTSRNLSILVEFENASSVDLDLSKGLLSFGVRIRSTNLSWELAGLKPLNYSGELLFLPLLKVGYYFN